MFKEQYCSVYDSVPMTAFQLPIETNFPFITWKRKRLFYFSIENIIYTMGQQPATLEPHVALLSLCCGSLLLWIRLSHERVCALSTCQHVPSWVGDGMSLHMRSVADAHRKD